MTASDEELIGRLAFYMADEFSQLGRHEGRWYSNLQRTKMEGRAKNILTLLRNEGFVIERHHDRELDRLEKSRALPSFREMRGIFKADT